MGRATSAHGRVARTFFEATDQPSGRRGLRRLRGERRPPPESAAAVTFISRVALRSAVIVASLAAMPSFAIDAVRQVRDDAGDQVTVSNAPCRIVSLAPGTTAMLYAAGAAHCLV